MPEGPGEVAGAFVMVQVSWLPPVVAGRSPICMRNLSTRRGDRCLELLDLAEGAGEVRGVLLDLTNLPGQYS
jgi:hypothetical protein